MGWYGLIPQDVGQGVTVMNQRVCFIAEYLKGYFPFNELCLQFSISRKTACKWIDGHQREAYNTDSLYGVVAQFTGFSDTASSPDSNSHEVRS